MANSDYDHSNGLFDEQSNELFDNLDDKYEYAKLIRETSVFSLFPASLHTPLTNKWLIDLSYDLQIYVIDGKCNPSMALSLCDAIHSTMMFDDDIEIVDNNDKSESFFYKCDLCNERPELVNGNNVLMYLVVPIDILLQFQMKSHEKDNYEYTTRDWVNALNNAYRCIPCCSATVKKPTNRNEDYEYNRDRFNDYSNQYYNGGNVKNNHEIIID